MKYKNYENSAEEFATGLDLELISNKDVISARNTNRPIANLYENQESNYNLIQTLLKTVYGNTQGIVPDVLEEFVPETFSVGSFKNSTEDYFIRIPTGMMFIGKKPSESLTNNNGNPFLNKGDYKYKDNVHKTDFLQDRLNSFVIENKPEINLYERELANLIGLDLTDLTNDIRIFQDLIPLTVRVAVTDENDIVKYDSFGSPMYLTDENSRVIYLAEEGKGDLDVFYDEALADIKNLVYKTTYKTTINSETSRLNDEIIKQTIVYKENIKVKPFTNGRYTSDISKALKLKDANGNTKYRTGYYMNVVRATSQDDEVVWLPNKKHNASWDVYLAPIGFGADTTVEVNIKDANGSSVETLSFNFSGDIDYTSLNNQLFYAFNTDSNKFIIEKTQKNDATGNPIVGATISYKSDFEEGNKLTLTISYTTFRPKSDGAVGYDVENGYLSDQVTGTNYKDLLINPKEEQKYYTDIFELTNSFMGYYSSSFINIGSIYNYLNLETIIKIPEELKTLNKPGKYGIYYDLNGNVENQTNDKYDKTGRFCIDNPNTLKGDNFIKLYDITIVGTNKSPNNFIITDVESFIDVLDRRLISTKKAELNSLVSTTRTELSNYVVIKDADGNRSFEITEKSNNENDEQTRLASPIVRIVDKNSYDVTDSPAVDTWEDVNNGDTPSDFFEESFEILDTTKSSTDAGFRKYGTHKDSGNKGIIIDRNRGIRIFNNDKVEASEQNNTRARNAEQDFKPIEIISNNGNINILNTDNSNGRINIRNLRDNSTNMIDILGKTRIRSRNQNQLVIRRIGEINNKNNSASIAFTIGTSFSKNDTDTINETENLFAGALSFYSGKTGDETNNIVESNRLLELTLASANTNTRNSLFTARTSTGTDVTKFTTSYSSNIVPSNNNFILGFPKSSRTYSETNHIPYIKDEEVSKVINKDGTSTEYIGNENRWLAAFIKNGYFGNITLADTENDKSNSDSRSGVLRLGDSNIFDISRIFLNKNYRMINFDNQSSTTSENTIYSSYEAKGEPDDNGFVQSDLNGFYFTLNRELGSEVENIVNTSSENATNYCGLAIKTFGTEVNKNLYISRQLLVNNHLNSSKKDNSSLVVKGQSVMRGELIIGKDADIVDDSINNKLSAITRNTNDSYKDYNEEFFEEQTTGTSRAKDANGNYTYEGKEDCLNLLVNNGRTHLKGDVTVDGMFTEDGLFNKKLTIRNRNYANYRFNEVTENCPTGDTRYVSTKDLVKAFYDSRETAIPRNNVSLDVQSGKIIFGSDTLNIEDTDDSSDLFLYGSQWVKRRLEIGSDGTKLINTTMSTQRLHDSATSVESPSLYVEGASQFGGDVVFGHLVKTNDNNVSVLASNKISSGNEYKPIKVIFWGYNSNPVDKNWNSDFDFHGRTWFDNNVKIGTSNSDVRAADSNGDNVGKLEVYGNKLDGEAALTVEGQVILKDGKDSSQSAASILLTTTDGASSGAKTASLSLNAKDKNSKYTGEAILSGSSMAKLSSTDNAYVSAVSGDKKVTIYGNSEVQVKSAKIQLCYNDVERILANGDGICLTGATTTIRSAVQNGNSLVVNTNGISLTGTTTVNGNTTIKSSDNKKSLVVDTSGISLTGATTITGDTTVNGNTTIKSSDNKKSLVVDTSGISLTGDTTITGATTIKSSNNSLTVNSSEVKIDLNGANVSFQKSSSKFVAYLNSETKFVGGSSSNEKTNSITFKSSSFEIDTGTLTLKSNGKDTSIKSNDTNYLKIGSTSATLRSDTLTLQGKGTPKLEINNSQSEFTGKIVVPNGNFYIGGYKITIS